MRILWMTLECILPANTGGRIGVFKRLEQMTNRGHEVYLFFPYDSDIDEQGIQLLKKYCKQVRPYRRKKTIPVLFNSLRYPYTVASRNIPNMKRDIQKCLDEEKIDIINVDFPHMLIDLVGLDLKGTPVILNEHNVEWKFYRQISESATNKIKKFAYRFDAGRLKKYEEHIVKCINPSFVTFVSTDDKEYYSKWMGFKDKLELIPVGADSRKKDDGINKNQDGKIILFVGKMSAEPNIDAVTWFSKEVFPNIKKEMLDVKFYIVGRDPSDAIKKLASDSITVTGGVESVEEYYTHADLVVLPLRYGGGVKIKLLEAISYKKPIVSTSIGVEGTLYKDGKTIPVADDEIKFSNLCVEMLNSGRGIDDAYCIFERNYTWSSVGDKYENLFKKVGTNG